MQVQKLYTLHKNIFNQYELQHCGTIVKIYNEKDGAAAMDAANVDLIIDTVTGFVLKHGGKLNKYFTGQKLMNARYSKEQLQRFVTGCNNLKKNGKASTEFVYYLLEEFALNSIENLNSDKHPYSNDYGAMLYLLNEFAKEYSPALFAEENEFTPANREFYVQ